MLSELQNRAFQLCGMLLIHTNHKQPSHLLASSTLNKNNSRMPHSGKMKPCKKYPLHCNPLPTSWLSRWSPVAIFSLILQCSIFLEVFNFFQMSSSMHHVTRQPFPSPWSLYGEHPRGTKASRLQWMHHTLAQITTQELYPQRGTSRPVNDALKNAIKMWQNFNLQLIWN